jgi:hypothetical protein
VVTKTELPESWQKPKVPDVVKVPAPDHTDPAQLYAWYGPFGISQEYRKVVLSSAAEIVRAQAAVDGEKMTDKIADAQSHLHPSYLAFLERTLHGRILYEREVIKRGIGG